MNKHNAIGVRDTETGDTTVCASADVGAGYSTLCGNSLNDDTMEACEISDRARITCCRCRMVWEEARRFKLSDFA